MGKSTRTHPRFSIFRAMHAMNFHKIVTLRTFILWITLFMLMGCSGVYVKNPAISSNTEALSLYGCVQSSSEMNIFDKKLSREENQTEFEHNIESAIEDIEAGFLSQKTELPHLVMTDLKACKRETELKENESTMFLAIDLSGYGSIKKKWKRILIGTGIIEGIAQGIIITSATQNIGLGLGIAAEEIISEYLTWNGVDWIFGETYAPVTLEASLSYQGRILWKDSYFVTENSEELNKEERKIKSRQLVASLHKAERKLFGSFSKYVLMEISGQFQNE